MLRVRKHTLYYSTSLDLCILFANILDNAIDGAKDAEPYVIKFDVWKDDGKLYIKCENSYQHLNLKKKGNFFETTKVEVPDEHGFGFEILRETAEKYGGEIICKADGGVFKIAVVLNYPV